MKSLIVLCFSAILFCCYNQSPIPPSPTIIPIDTEKCPDAEQHLQSLCSQDSSKNAYCCEIVKPTSQNKSFTQFCQETQNAGIFLNPACLANVSACSEIDTCTKSGE